MKKLGTLMLLALFVMTNQTNAQRYLTEIFDDVDVATDITYGQNVTVITVSDTTINAPSLQDLKMDVYTPAGDTETERPLLINIHTGNFLPQGTNGNVNGLRTDPVNVELAMRFARMGYVVANIDYRLGWNPLDPDAEERRSGLINAAYRGIQDSRTCIRFFRKNIDLDGNTYGVCEDRIAMIGNGTGGYIVLGAATINNYNELLLPKFFNNSTGLPMVIEQVSGDPFAVTDGFLPLPDGTLLQLNVANHVDYSSDFNLAINMGGAVGDSSWISADDVAIISFQCPNDPFAPYEEDDLIVPTTGEFVVEVQGARIIAEKANALGLNDAMIAAGISDSFTDAAALFNEGFEGLFPLNRPCPPSFFPPNAPSCEASPWEWWDAAFWSQIPHPSCGGAPVTDCNFHIITLNSNQDMSMEKGMLYCDTIVGYSAPRMYAVMDLGNACLDAIEPIISAEDVALQIAPNPANNEMTFRSADESPIQAIEIYNLAGQLIRVSQVEASSFVLDRDKLNSGIFIAKIRFEQGIVSKKVVFN